MAGGVLQDTATLRFSVRSRKEISIQIGIEGIIYFLSCNYHAQTEHSSQNGSEHGKDILPLALEPLPPPVTLNVFRSLI
jgi:hypothetical protein